jgi:tricorn protease
MALAAASALAAPTLYRQPALGRTHIVFSYAGDLWTVPREGGEAKRLTNHPGNEANPRISPDGTTVAFSAEYDGNIDLFTVPITGGVPKRVTYHPSPDAMQNWTPDGKLLFSSSRNAYTRFNSLFTIAANGVFPTELPLHMAEQGSFNGDGSLIAYVPLAPAFQSWKRYRGGRTTHIWIARLSDSSIVDRVPRAITNDPKIPRYEANDYNPMWIGDRVYFLSDRDGTFTLYFYDLKSKKVERALPNGQFDIKSATAGPGAIVYEQFGTISLYDLKTGKTKPVDIRVTGDLPEVRPRLERVGTRIANGAVSPTGVRAIFEARGEIFTVPVEKGDIRNLTSTPGVAERDPSWSPDGQQVAYFSDATGEYQLHVRDALGKNPAKAFPLSDPAHFYYSPTWSPDAKKIAYLDKKMQIGVLDLASGKVTIVDKDRYDGPRKARSVSWSPDGKWLTYTKQLPSSLRVVMVYSLDSAKSTPITDGLSDADAPVFDADGKHLHFVASTDVGLNIGWRDMTSYFRPSTASAYTVVLRKDLPSPLLPESDEEKVEEPKKADESKKPDAPKGPPSVTIDFDAIDQRIVALPIPTRSFTDLVPGKPGVLFLIETPFTPTLGPQSSIVHKFDFKTRKLDRLVDGVQAFVLAAKGEKALIRQPGNRWSIVGVAAPPKPGDGALRLDSMETRVEPAAEWRQMYHEAWRILRDFFYDPGLHGVNVPELKKRYEPYLEALGSRSDLNYVMADMLGEFSTSHLNVGGGQTPEVRRVRGGLLGADYTIENNRYRFARVYNGESWNPDLRAPLTQPGVNVKAGEYLLAVNGRDLTATENLYAAFEGTAGKQISIRVGPQPDGTGARDVTVIPLETEQRLRNLAWIEGNRRRVDQMSGGKLAYVYLPDTTFGGYTSFNRYFFAQAGKQGAVIDERFNAGGSQPDYILDYLRRTLMHYRTQREGDDFTGPLGAIFGPKAMLINEYAGSGGDTMPWYFRTAKVGPLIGKRTWGGLVGGLGGYPQLVDGGLVSAPAVGFWDPAKREWVAENTGVGPDIEIDQDPKAIREGKDPQLHKAIEMLMDELKKSPPPVHQRPAFPKYH